jgi:hypothetical protein
LSVRIILVLGSVLALPVGAQEKPKEPYSATLIPPSAQPPAGLCRVWLKDVPASQQPAPTDCRTAVRNRPATAQVIFGPSGTEGLAPKGRSGFNATRSAEQSTRTAGASSRTITPSGQAAGQTAGGTAVRTADPPSSPRASTVGTTGTPRRIEAPPSTKPPEKP